MAIAFDAASNGVQASGNTDLTVAHTCTGSALFLIVSTTQQGNNDNGTCTYNGVAMTKFTSQLYSNGRSEVFYLQGPATGTHNIVASSNCDSKSLAAASYTGHGGGIDANNGSVSDTGVTSLTGSNTSIADNCWTILGAGTQVNGQAAGAGATQRAIGAQLNCTAGVYDSNGPKTPAGSVSETVTFSSARYGYTILSIKPLVPKTVTDASSMTEGMVNGNKLTEVIGIFTVYLKTMADALGLSETYFSFQKNWANVAKVVSSWVNQTKP